MNTMIALLRREILEHRSIWLMPLILIGIAILVRLSLSFGNLELNIDVPSQLNLDEPISSVLDGAIAHGLNLMNYLIMMTLFAVACFYTLSCLYNERQDESVLFWRSLPISDTTTIVSKLAIALLVVPLTVILSQTVVAIIFFGINALDYLSVFFSGSLSNLLKVMLWSLLPTVSWCLFCSEVAKKNPFLLAFIAPILLWICDWLFLDGSIVKLLQVNRWVYFNDYSMMSLISGLAISAIGITVAVIKRSQRI
jgi:ABC-2 type transport system permease protein